MITKELAHKALEVLDLASTHYVNNLYGEDYIKVREGILLAYNNLRDFINQAPDTPAINVKVMYKYMLRRGDGKYMDASQWNDKGKVYKNRNAMAAGIGNYISNAIERHPDRPRYIYNAKTFDTPEEREKYQKYNEAYTEWYVQHQKKEVRAEYIPNDWTVIAIPINAPLPKVEINAKEWYKGAKP